MFSLSATNTAGWADMRFKKLFAKSRLLTFCLGNFSSVYGQAVNGNTIIKYCCSKSSPNQLQLTAKVSSLESNADWLFAEKNHWNFILLINHSLMAQKSVQKHVPIIADAHLFFNLLVSLGCNHRDDYSFFLFWT